MKLGEKSDGLGDTGEIAEEEMRGRFDQNTSYGVSMKFSNNNQIRNIF